MKALWVAIALACVLVSTVFAVTVTAPPELGDVNDDSYVDMTDLSAVIADFGKTTNFNASADRNSDGRINLFDVVRVTKHWGSRYAPYMRLEQQNSPLGIVITVRCPPISSWCQVQRLDGSSPVIVEGAGSFQSALDTNVTANQTYTYRARYWVGAEESAYRILNITVNVSGDITPPVRLGSYPSGVLPAGTRSYLLAIATDENATCKLGLVAGTAYAAILYNFTITGGTAHYVTMTQIADNTNYNIYTRCMDTSGNVNTNDYTISFRVNADNGLPLFEDDFETGNLAKTANNFSWGDTTSVTVQPVVGRGGSYGARFIYGPNLPGEDGWAELRFAMPPLQDVWFEYYIYIPPNYVHRVDLPDNNKWWRLIDDEDDYNTVALLESWSGTLTRARPIWGTNAAKGGLAASEYNMSTPDGLIVAADRGNWVQFRFHVRVSDPGQQNGVFQMWKNGTLFINNTRIPNDPINRLSLYYTAGYLMGWANSGFTNRTDIIIDDFKLYSTNPGWGPDTTPPTANITAPTAAQVFAAGTTQVTLSVTSNEAATCRWSTTDQAYASMPNTMSGSGTASHTANTTGLTDGQSYTRYVRCQDTAGNPMLASQSRSFSVASAGGGSVNVLFSSDWNYGTGTSNDAYMDGIAGSRNWTNMAGCAAANQTQVAQIIAGGSVGWTATPNVMQLQRIQNANGNVGCFGVERQGYPGISVGDDYFIRMYARSDVTSTANLHPVTLHQSGDIQGILWTAMGGAATHQPHIVQDNPYPSESAQDRGWRPTPDLSRATWYRHEWQIEILALDTPVAGQATYRVWPRIYDMNGNLIRDHNSYIRRPGWGGNATQTLGQWYAAGNSFRASNQDFLYHFGVGHEGQLSATSVNEPWYYASVAVCDDWCGD